MHARDDGQPPHVPRRAGARAGLVGATRGAEIRCERPAVICSEQKSSASTASSQRVNQTAAPIQRPRWHPGGGNVLDEQRQVDPDAADDDHHQRPSHDEHEPPQGEAPQRVKIEGQPPHPGEAEQDQINLHADAEQVLEEEAQPVDDLARPQQRRRAEVPVQPRQSAKEDRLAQAPPARR